MRRKQKRQDKIRAEGADEGLDGGGELGSEEQLEAVELQAAVVQAAEVQGVKPEEMHMEEVELTQQEVQRKQQQALRLLHGKTPQLCAELGLP